MTDHTDKSTNGDMTSEIASDGHAEERRKLVKKLATGAFGAPVVLAGLSRKAAAASGLG